VNGKEIESERLAVIQSRLNIATVGLTRVEREAALKIAQQLVERLTVEAWGHKEGWAIPEYGTPEWRELHAAWLESDDDGDVSRRPR
jgi:hypothetical protein